MGCTPEPESKQEASKDNDEETTKAATRDDAFLGLTAEAAEALAKERDLKFRIGSVDGDNRPLTMDYRPDRITVSIEKGKVIKVDRG